MNECQLRDLKKYEENVRRLRPIVAELNQLDMGDVGAIGIQPPREDSDHTPRFIIIEAKTMDATLEIMCERSGYGFTDKWQFTATGWPSYTDENDSKHTIHPSNLWNPKESCPWTRARQDREPKAIAKQVASKIIPEYLRIYASCVERAEDAQGHSNQRAEGLHRLAKACGDSEHYVNRQGRKSSFYIRDLPGDTVSVESRSHGDVQIRLHTDEMIEVIAMLRDLRAEKVAA